MLHGNKNDNDGLPPILTPFDFYNDESGRTQHACITVPNATVGTIGKISDLMDENIISTARVVLPAASHSLTKSTNCTLHRKAKIPQTRFKCGKCRQSFLTNTKLRSHIYHLHGQSQRRKKCRKTHRPSSKPWSSYLREVLNIKCPICNLAFKDHEILGNHVRLAHQRILAYDCVNCNTKLKTVEGVRSHMYFSHGKIFQSNQELLSLKNVKCNYTFVDAPTGPGMTLFPVAAKVQQSPSFLTQSADNPAETNSIVNKNSIQSIIKTQYQCMWPMCEKKFASSGGRARHYKTHTECNSYQCQQCDKFYSRNCALNRHMRNTHGFQSRFPNTNDSSDQLGQRQRVDDGAKETEPVNMLIESLIANYSTAPVLNNHKSQGGNHNEEQESFEAIIDQPVLKCGCPKMGCEMRFSSQTEVINHHHSHHGSCHPGEESEVEPEATKSTAITKRAPLAGSPNPIYQRTRNDMCPKSARKLRYQCHWEGCKWKFRDKYELTRHLRTHTGETPFRCAVCFQLFARSDNLKTHNIKCQPKSPQ
ncbi:Krueppel-like factor 12 [Orchesella cincta]|uniref:Krueppel-like factor 12 n=1 Tax=Orchesella cincta TaxID=48709 RepID=A0A1D2MKL2_ORCCI|nr:Krueppel-like factor 12 [Orchesella cincta]